MTTEALPIQMVKVTGTPGNGFWSQIHTFTPDEPEKLISRGTLLASITVRTDKQGVEAVSYGREILGRLHEEYFGNSIGNAFDCLKKAIERISYESLESQIAVAVIVKNKIIMAVSPGAAVWLKRGDDFGRLLYSNNGVEMLTGELFESDTYLLASSIFTQVVPVGTVKIALGDSLEQAGEMVGPMVLGHEQSGGASGLFFRVNKITPPEEPVEFSRVGNRVEPYRETLSTIDARNNQPVREIYLKSVRLRRMTRKFLPYLGVLIVLFVVIFGISKVAGSIGLSRRESKNKVLIAALKTKVEEGVKKIDNDPARLSDLVVELSNQVQEIENLKLEETEEYLSIKKSIDQLKNETNQAGFIKDPAVFMDLSLVENGIDGSKLTIVGKNLLVLTSDGKGVVVFDVTKKSYKKYTFEKSYTLMAGDASRIYLLGDNDIVEVSVTSGKIQPVSTDNNWINADGLAVYSGNAYVLDKQKSNLWRLPAIEGGLGSGSNWLKEAVDLSGSADLAVDGSVWVLDTNKIRKFNLGKEVDFNVNGDRFKLTKAGIMWTSVDSNELLVLDKESGRLYRIDKEGVVVKSYQSPVFKNTISLTSGGKKAYLLDGKKIFEVGLE